MARVMVFGTFDLLHPGHLHFFQQAREHGSPLTAVVARDQTVLRIKGSAPQQSETERLEQVRSAPGVDVAILGDPTDPYRVIREQQPDVICLGYDQVSRITEGLSGQFPEIQIIRLQAHHPEKFKSSFFRSTP